LPRRKWREGDNIPNGTWPSRDGQYLEYTADGDISLVDTLVVHYPGDPVEGGSKTGYEKYYGARGTWVVDDVASFQTGPKRGLQFPEIAYTWVITPDGTLYQCHDLETQTWQVGDHNHHTRGVLLTGFGRLGTPTEAQWDRLQRLHQRLSWHLDPETTGRVLALRPHNYFGGTVCPGEATTQFLKEKLG
jgi:hypothetical protein